MLFRSKGKKKSLKAKTPSASPVAEPLTVNRLSRECYGELDWDTNRNPVLRVFVSREGPGKRPEASQCLLGDQAYRILEAGLKNARAEYMRDVYEKASDAGRFMDPSECEPEPEKTFIVEWSQDDLATAICEVEQYSKLNGKQKQLIKTAMHRLRTLVRFTGDNVGLVTDRKSVV